MAALNGQESSVRVGLRRSRPPVAQPMYRLGFQQWISWKLKIRRFELKKPQGLFELLVRVLLVSGCAAAFVGSWLGYRH